MLTIEDIQHYNDNNFTSGISEVVYRRTYSRIINGKNENWKETVLRVVNGIFDILNIYEKNVLDKYDSLKFYDMIYNMKFLPAGRGLWSLGSDIIKKKKLFASLNNCAFVSTKDVDIDPIKPFSFVMDMSMLGCGVGFDTRGKNKIRIMKPIESDNVYVIEDSREGWVKSVEFLLMSYFLPDIEKVSFDYSKIRKKGELLQTFGGIAPGYEPLKDLHDYLFKRLDSEIGNLMSLTLIVDIMNNIGKCVVAGNMRRSSAISLGDTSYEFMNLKNYEINPHRIEFGWCSNNSIVINDIKDIDINKIVECISYNGEPGIIFMSNIQKYGRMGEEMKDTAIGINPCGEQPLESFEMCNLVEVFLPNINTLKEFKETLKYAYYYGKIVSLGLSHWKETAEVQKRNRRIGISLSGITQFISKFDINTLIEFCNIGYKYVRDLDIIFSDKLNINKSIRLTTVKPSGTLSLIAGCSPGVHFPFSEYYIRRVRIEKDSNLVKILKSSNYEIEDCFYSKTSSVISFPVHISSEKTVKNTSIFDKVELAILMQKYWSDNSVSVTIEFHQHEKEHIKEILLSHHDKVKNLSFLPTTDNHYVQMPYEEITKEKYLEMKSKLKPLNLSHNEDKEYEYEIGCSNDNCSL